MLSQVAGSVFGFDSIGFYLFLTFAAIILMLAANTSFSAFPRLAAVLAEDNFMPRRFAYRGDRLAFTAGIVVLGVLAGILIVIFGGDTHALIPLYAVGVFIDFTISQTGMIRHWLRERPPGLPATPDASTPSGAVITGLVAIDVAVVKAPASLHRARAHPHPGRRSCGSSTTSTTPRPRSWRSTAAGSTASRPSSSRVDHPGADAVARGHPLGAVRALAVR